MTYAELELEVLALAETLRADFGVTADSIVGVLIGPSVDSVIAYLAILSAGGAFLPIELAYTAKMVRDVCADAKPAVIVTTSQRASSGAEIGGISAIAPRGAAAAARKTLGRAALLRRRAAAPRVALDDLAFVVYSSGTTGEPKGITIPHRAPVLSYAWRFEIDPLGPGDRVACNVFFIWECIRPLIVGACTYCVPAEVIYDGEALLERIERQRITEILFTPTLFQNFLATTSAAARASGAGAIKTVHLNGEVVTVELARRGLAAFPAATFFNLYSISECHEVTCCDLRECVAHSEGRSFCPVGVPSALVDATIRDEEGQLVPDGTDGELYIGGDLLARGYLLKPELTAERFVYLDGGTAAEADASRAYRTGDRVRRLANGMLLHLGRCDSMVKIRGYSVVLGKIEHALLDACALDSCAVIADGAEGTEKRLVAFIVRAVAEREERGIAMTAARGTASDARAKPKLHEWTIDAATGHCREIRRALVDSLAHYMVPTVFIELEALPLHPIGKLNVGKLKEAARAQRGAGASDANAGIGSAGGGGRERRRSR